MGWLDSEGKAKDRKEPGRKEVVKDLGPRDPMAKNKETTVKKGKVRKRRGILTG